MKTRSGEEAGDPTGSHPGTERSQAANQVADELRESAHRLPDLDERGGAFVIKPRATRNSRIASRSIAG